MKVTSQHSYMRQVFQPRHFVVVRAHFPAKAKKKIVILA